jgi:4-amino-4-deoxy-L-arabinose transferase-like glycosyltransferase
MMAVSQGLFGVENDDEPPSRPLFWVTIGLVVLVAGWQLYAMLPMDRSPDVVRAYPGERGAFFALQWWLREVWTVGTGKGWVLAAVLAPVVGYATWRVARQKQRRLFYIYLFYICCGLTVPAKGWLGWAPMGGALLGYLLVTGDWKQLGRVDIPMGLLLVFVVGHPWIIAMLGGHHPAWAKRFWIHDHVNRLFAGVHSTDDGGFEYFIQWIGYGLFPWVALLPAGLARGLAGLRRRAEGYTPRERFEVLVLLWAVFAFFLFSKSSTKFHHYIFPCIPPLAILVALCLEDVFAGRAKAVGLMATSAAGIALWIGQDLFRMPAAYGQSSQHLINLFTYKYDREWPKYTAPGAMESLTGDARELALTNNQWLGGLGQQLLAVTLVAVAGLVLVALLRDARRRYGAAVLSASGVWMAVFCLHDYLPKVSEHWSQADLWSAYYNHCTPYDGTEEAWSMHMLTQSGRVPSKGDVFPRKRCVEPIVAYRMNWRGEAFYSANTVLPAIDTKNLAPFLKQWGEHKPFYLFTERSRIKGELEPHLPKHLKGQYTEVFGRNLKFVLLRIEEGVKPEPEAVDGPVDDVPPAEPSGGL